jgi:hypothetical protein
LQLKTRIISREHIIAEAYKHNEEVEEDQERHVDMNKNVHDGRGAEAWLMTRMELRRES